LLRWQEAGVVIYRAAPGENAPAKPIIISRPRWFRHQWYGLLASLGLRRNLLGGYGGYLPLPSAG
jgi:hypothetical protein